MSDLEELMNHEREFSGLAKLKKQRSEDKSLNLFYRNKNLYEFKKVSKELARDRREIEQLADDVFPFHLKIDIHELLNGASK